MNVVHHAVAERLDGAIHEVDAPLDVRPRRAERERLEEEHGSADDAEVRPYRRVLEIVAGQKPLDDGAQEVTAAIHHLLDVLLVRGTKTSELAERQLTVVVLRLR